MSPFPPADRCAVRMRTVVLLLVLGALLAQPLAAAPQGGAAGRSFPGWSAAALDDAATLPVQEGGRVKPLASFALYTLMAFSGRRKVEVEGADALTPTEWLLDVLFVPDVAAHQRVFRVQDDAALDAIGLPHEGRRKRDWYSFAELVPAWERLMELGDVYGKQPPSQRGRVEEQVYVLAQNLLRYHRLQESMRFATNLVPTERLPAFERFFEDEDAVPWSRGLEAVPELAAALPPPLAKDAAPPKPTPDQIAVMGFLMHMEDGAQPETVAFFPPPRSADGTAAGTAWRTAHDVLRETAAKGRVEPDTLALVRSFERLGGALASRATAERAMDDLHREVVGRARERGEYDKVPLEATYHRWKLLGYSLGLFLLGGLLALTNLFVRGRWRWLVGALSWASVGGAALLLVGAIVMRCVIRSRPPISTLYEVTLFITATGAVVGLAIEVIGGRRWPLAVAAWWGAIGLYVAARYEELTATDTMPTLQAVLDTNFWLSTHVTSVTLGYTAGLLAGAIGAIHIVGRALGLGRNAHAFYAAVARVTYGVLCFGLLFSTVGTILGGIWANDSWGRFWGWDPKENGALMIVLWNLAIIHARLGGHIGPHGLSLMAVFGTGIVVFSYWGVNLLGVGLHSYGFTSGLGKGLAIFYGAVLAPIVVMGLVHGFVERGRRVSSPPD